MKNQKKITYQVIVSAKNGNTDAMQQIMKCYEPYICHFSTRKKYINEFDFVEVIDEDIKQQIETKLIMEIILHFDLDRLPEGEVLED